MSRKNRNISTRRKQNSLYIIIVIFILTILSLLFYFADNLLKLGITKYSNPFIITSIVSIITFQIIIWILRNKAYKGIKHSAIHYSTVLNIRKAFLDIKYFNEKLYFNRRIAQLPNIILKLDNDLSRGKLFIENINIKNDLSKINISIALNKYVVEKEYLSKDEMYSIFEIYDSSIEHQLIFESLEEFKNHSLKIEDMSLFIDKFTTVSLHSSLFVGQTGSGKTYALYSLILQMLLKKELYNLYFADPKNSSLAVIGEKVSSNNTAISFDEIVNLLKKFNELMDLRKIKIKNKLDSQLEATYVDFGYSAHVLMFDEFASFQTVLQSMEKKKRDEVMKLISQVVLQGRQLGFFIWFVMQKSDSNQLPTYIRENLPVKFVLGNAEKQTYITGFGSDVVNEKNFALGESLFICPNVTNQPKICHFSYLDFDILEAVKKFL